MITYAPYFISTVVMVGMLMQMTDLRIGIINKLLGLFGVGPVNLRDVDIFRSLYVWRACGRRRAIRPLFT